MGKDQRRLARDKKAIDAQIAAEAKCEDVQMLKFGQIIDLSVIEKAGNSQDEDAITARLKEVDTLHDEELSKLRADIKGMQQTHMKVTQDNTKLLFSISSLTKDQHRLEKDLGSSGGMSVADQGPAQHKSLEERN